MITNLICAGIGMIVGNLIFALIHGEFAPPKVWASGFIVAFLVITIVDGFVK